MTLLIISSLLNKHCNWAFAIFFHQAVNAHLLNWLYGKYCTCPVPRLLKTSVWSSQTTIWLQQLLYIGQRQCCNQKVVCSTDLLRHEPFSTLFLACQDHQQCRTVICAFWLICIKLACKLKCLHLGHFPFKDFLKIGISRSISKVYTCLQTYINWAQICSVQN